MRLVASSFSRSFLLLVSGFGASSPRRALRVLLGARRRWPDGRLSLSASSGGVHARWMVGGTGPSPFEDGCCGVMVSLYLWGRWSRPRSGV